MVVDLVANAWRRCGVWWRNVCTARSLWLIVTWVWEYVVRVLHFGLVCVFYLLWVVVVLVTAVVLMVEVDVLAPQIFGGGVLRVVSDNGLVVFLLELCCFIVHGYAWKVPAVMLVVNKFSSPIRRLFGKEPHE